MKKSILLTLSCLSILTFNLSADGWENEKYHIVKERNSLSHSIIPTFVKFSTNSLPNYSELESLFEQYWKVPENFGFMQTRKEVDQLGFVHYRYKQTYKGVPIEFAELIVHTKEDLIHSMNGKLIHLEPTEREQQLNESSALEAALNFIGADTYKWEVVHEEMHLKETSNDPSKTFFPKGELAYVSASTSIEANQLRKAYKFKVYAHEPMSHTEIYVDASNGEILYTNNLIHTSNVKGTATTAYSGSQTINTDSVSATQFRLRQTLSGNGVNTYDLNGGTTYANAVDFTDTDNNWNNTINNDHYATDAHWGAEKTQEYLDVMFNRNSIDNNGFALNSYIHYSVNFANAFWDGSRMTYGDGSGAITPLVSLDIAGHEIAHGLTTFTADLVYESQSGALNESFSDIFGAAIEFYARPTRANWTIGEDIGSTIRSMSNPGAYRDPDTRGGTNWVTTAGCTPSRFNDQCGVHSNSGVQNFWFYLLSVGGSGTNDNGDAYSVTSITIDSAAAIAYRNLSVYLTRSSDYDDARFYSIEAAIDLYGPCSQEVESVTDAWHAVGVGNAYVAGVSSDFASADSVSCNTPHVVTFTNLSNNGLTYDWDFGDGRTSTLRSPIHVYRNFGEYDVELIVDGGACGVDTLLQSNYISIDTLNRCVVNMVNGSNGVQTECQGKLFDSGGAGGNYGDSESSTITFSPAGASSVTLDFLQFDVEAGQGGGCNFDYLEVFDGPTVNDPSLGLFCNSSAAPGKITSTFGSITIRFVSDQAATNAGFEVNWDCNFPTQKPAPDFLVSEDTSCTGAISFSDRSTEKPTNWTWDFGDGNSSTNANPIHTYTSNGTYSVKLVATNGFGSDSITKTNVVHIDRPTSPSVVSDTVCINRTANLSATGSGSLRWYSNEVGGSSLFTGTSYSVNNVSKDSTLWVEDFISAPVEKVGPVNNTIGSGVYFTGSQYLIFDVFETITLRNVQVYSNTRGSRLIELRDNNGVVLQSSNIYIPSRAARISINFTIEPGMDYQLGISSTSGAPNLYRNNSGVNYPYDIAGKVSIKNSSAGTGFYYFFYDWEVKGSDCVSARSEITAFLDPQCAVTGIDEELSQADEQLQVYPNPANSSITIDYSLVEDLRTMSLIDMRGKEIMNVESFDSSMKQQLDVSQFSNGIYFLQVHTQSATFTRKIIINH